MTLFFESDYQVDPIFEYSSCSNVESALKKCGNVHKSFLDIATRILENSSSEDNAKGPLVSGTIILEEMKKYAETLGLSKKITFAVSTSLLSVSTVSHSGPGSKPIVLVNPESTLPLDLVKGVCAHEIGTHVLRMLNNDKQVWAGANRKLFSLSNHLPTEEGLATLNTLVASGRTSLYNSALNYFAVSLGDSLGFAALFSKLSAYMEDPVKRFKLCTKVKRGLVNTEESGACCLEQSYFIGAIEILRNLNRFDIRHLYCGQIALEDLARIWRRSKKGDLLLPDFLLADQYDKYLDNLRVIAKANFVKSIGLGT